ncbi:response regulator transcription factor [Ramlibacter henchirensis]|uniref:Response regulator transcription factor n=1 Tax=Ramlibacter henchirensis TaxID=204072 RepID=A0A4Z0C3C7_9BURK|nr:response regulator transcription factor [Ramlibacter henchirensis]TFZ06177.1 response regulator transcription factor [Ramlibacter henchirensis]
MLTPSGSLGSNTARFGSAGPQPAAAARRRILLVDGNALVRMSAIDLCAAACAELEVLEATSLRDALALHAEHEDSVELVLLDLNLPDSKGFAALQMIKRRHPRSRVVVVSGAYDAAVSAEAYALGAEKYLHRGAEPGVLASILSDLTDPLARKPGRDAAAAAAARRSSPSTANALSPREIEILSLVLQGKTNQEIVAETCLKLGTIKNYISCLFVVFGVTSRSKLVSLFD